MSWDALTAQIHHRSNHLTLSKRKNENLQSTEKISISATYFYACLFTSFRYLNTMVLLESTDLAILEESKDFFPNYSHPMIYWF